MREQAKNPRITQAWHERASGRYVCALVIAFLATVIRLSLNPLLGTEYAYIVFYPALMIAATVCGFVPGLVSAAAMMTVSVLWLHPRPLDRVDKFSLGVFAVSAFLMCIVGGLYRGYRGSDKLLRMVREEASQRDRAERDLKETQGELAEDLANSRRLHNLALRYVSEGNLDTVLKEILDAAVQITHAQKGTLQFHDAATRTLQIRAAQGFSPQWLQHFQTVHGDAASCGEATRTRARVVVPDVRLSPIFAGTLSLPVQLEAGVLAVQSTPLVSRSGEFLGMISTHFGEPHVPKDAQLHWIDLLCRQAADLIEHRRSEQALRKAQQVLEQTVQERTASLHETIQELETFSYSIAHDMRAPLRSMQGFAKILQEEHSRRLDDTARDYLERIIVSAQRLDALIQDVLNYSKIVRSDLPMEPVQTNQFVHQIIDSYPNLQAHKSAIHVQEPLPPVLANRAALTQVVSNLLGNAVKFTRPEIEADIHVRGEILRKPQLPSERPPSGADVGDGEHGPKNLLTEPSPAAKENPEAVVRLWFEDNGIGVPKGLYDRIFRMFERINAPEKFEGTGMGLTIVRKAVERMGGAVGVESEPGKGSRFWIELPKAA